MPTPNQFIEERLANFEKQGAGRVRFMWTREEARAWIRESLELQHEHDKKMMIEGIESRKLRCSNETDASLGFYKGLSNAQEIIKSM